MSSDQLLINLFESICEFSERYSTMDKPISVREESAKELRKDIKVFAGELFKKLEPEARQGLEYKATLGMTFMPHILWVAFLPKGCSVSSHISVAICFGRFGEGAVVGLMESRQITSYALQTIARTGKSVKVDVNGKKSSKKYNNSFVNPKEYLKCSTDIEDLMIHLNKSILILKDIMAKQNPAHNLNSRRIYSKK
jgi:hypothetical protein